MFITIATITNPGTIGWNILELFQNTINNVEMVCSRTVPEKTFFLNSFRKVIEACSRTVLEQTIGIFLKLFDNHSKYLLK